MTKSYVQAMAYSSIMLSIQYFLQSIPNFAKLKPIETWSQSILSKMVYPKQNILHSVMLSFYEIQEQKA